MLVWSLAACHEASDPRDRPFSSWGATGGTAETADTGRSAPELLLEGVSPEVVDPAGGSRLVLTGAGFEGALSVTVGGAPAVVQRVSDRELRVVSPAVAAGPVELVVVRGTDRASWPLDGFDPSSWPGARVFDAAVGVAVAEPTTSYEWQRLTADLGPDWRVRDGNTVTWLPATHRYWMVAGWNGYQEPDGFSSVPPDSVWPPENTTGEVWSSPDGVAWTPELPHGHPQFERRHSHNTVLWRDRLWMIGGDYHQGKYNHDVVSSADGVNWKVELGPGTTPPPWSERGLQVSGAYDGKLWTAGGQDLIGDPDLQVHHNDVWSTEDGVHWTQVAADAPASDTRWAGCGVLDGLVEFRGEMWLVGCARDREDAVGHSMSNEVWSTTDGLVWRRHAEPPWKGKIWPNVVVWDERLWILFGYTYGDPDNGWAAGNANEAWYSDDGETWTSLPVDAPVPGSHAQGVGVREDQLLLAGGNYGFGFGAGVDKSTWRLVPHRGEAVGSWTERGRDALVVSAPNASSRPVRVADAFGPGAPGLQFDGSSSVLALADPAGDAQVEGRSVFFVARAPYLPMPWGWIETYDPLATVVGGPVDGGWSPVSSVGLSGGRVVLIDRAPGVGSYGEPLFTRVEGGSGLQEGTGEPRFVGLTHAADGEVRVYVDGSLVDTGSAPFEGPRVWTRIGGGIDGWGEGPNSRFAGALGAVVVVPEVLDEAEVERMHGWARGRFGVP